MHLPCSLTPVGHWYQVATVPLCCPRPSKDEGSNIINFSRLNHTAFALAVYASSWKLLPNMQDSLPAVDQTLPGRSLPPARFLLKVSAYWHSPLPDLSWRNRGGYFKPHVLLELNDNAVSVADYRSMSTARISVQVTWT
ncbi:hypothetical protein [Desulfosporosinus sp. SB140]|uniref:hypothetical protein n=1 Tax=Desulfosporosinus paludis TaxID=3115649 RepID=UPI003890CBE0